MLCRIFIVFVFVLKFTVSIGQTPFVWTKLFKGSKDGAQVLDIAVDSQNRYLFVGTFDNSLQVENYNFQSRGSTDLFIAMTDSTGKIMWIKQWGGINEDGNVFVETDQYDNIYVSGFFFTSTLVENQLIEVNGGGSFIAKMNAGGDLIWTKTLGPYCQLMEIKVNKKGDFGIAGNYVGEVDFGGVVGDNTNTLQNVIFIASYTAEGELMWVKFPESSSRYWSDLATTISLIAFDDEGNSYETFFFENDVTIDGTVYHGKKSAFNLLFLKMDHTGTSNVGKVATMIDYIPPSDPAYSPGGYLFQGGGDVDSDGNFSLAGVYLGKLDFSDFKLVQANPASYPNNMIGDMFVLRFNKSFELEWSQVLNNNSTYGKLNVGKDNQLTVSGVCGMGLIGGCPINPGLFVMQLSESGQITRTANMGRTWGGTYNTSTLDQHDNVLTGGLIGFFEDYDSKNNLQSNMASGFAGKYKLNEAALSAELTPEITSKAPCIFSDSLTLNATLLKNISGYYWELFCG